MRILLLLSFLLVSSAIYSEEAAQQTPKKQEDTQKQDAQNKSVLVYPKELLKPLPELKPPDIGGKVEVVEVESTKYPALNIELPSLEQRLEVDKVEWAPPLPSPEYYQRGGGILALYGVREPSGQLFTTTIPLDPDEEAKEDEDDSPNR